MDYAFVCLQKSLLGQKIADAFNKPLHEVPLLTFADNEINLVIENAAQFKNKIVIIVQSTGHPVNNFILGIAFLAHELRNAGAAKIIGVIPYLGYSRQEQSSIAGKPGIVQVIANLFQNAGIDELITVELHHEKTIEFFSIPVHNLSVQSLIAAQIKKYHPSLADVCLIAPDEGRRSYVQAIAEQIGAGMLTFSKERFAPDQTRITGRDGHCNGSIGIIIDDILATGGTVINVVNSLAVCNYKSIYGYFVHPVLAGNALERIKKSKFETIYVGNTLPLPRAAENQPYIQQFDVSKVIIAALQPMIEVTGYAQ